MQTESIDGAKYSVTFIDDYSRCCKVYFLKQKSEVLGKFKEFEKTFSNECRQKVTRLRTDNGGEYISSEFQEYLKAQGIHHEMTVPHTPQQNGVAERKKIGPSLKQLEVCCLMLSCQTCTGQRPWQLQLIYRTGFPHLF